MTAEVRRGLAFKSHHPFVVISDPEQDAERIVLVNLTSCKTREDERYPHVIWPGEHPDIDRPSYVAFALARILPRRLLLRGLAHPDARPLPDFSGELLNRICRCAKHSAYVSREVRDLLEAQGLTGD